MLRSTIHNLACVNTIMSNNDGVLFRVYLNILYSYLHILKIHVAHLLAYILMAYRMIRLLTWYLNDVLLNGNRIAIVPSNMTIFRQSR